MITFNCPLPSATHQLGCHLYRHRPPLLLVIVAHPPLSSSPSFDINDHRCHQLPQLPIDDCRWPIVVTALAPPPSLTITCPPSPSVLAPATTADHLRHPPPLSLLTTACPPLPSSTGTHHHHWLPPLPSSTPLLSTICHHPIGNGQRPAMVHHLYEQEEKRKIKIL